MSRPLRIEYPDAWYHVMNRGRRHEAIFRGEEDYLRFLELLKEASVMWNVHIAAFCLMPTHYHLLIQTPDANLSRFMRHMDGVYTQRFNRFHGCDGSLFRGRYKAILVEAKSYLLDVLKYIHRNPLRARLATRLDRYPWTSHKGYLSRAEKWNWLHRETAFTMLNKRKSKQAEAYREFMAGAESVKLMDLFSRSNLPSVLGSPAFIDWVRAGFQTRIDHPEIPRSNLLAPGMDAIKALVCATYGIHRKQLLSARRGETNEPRNVAIYLSRRLSGETLTVIGAAFGLDKYSSVSSVVSRMKQEMRSNRKLLRRVEALEKHLNKR